MRCRVCLLSLAVLLAGTAGRADDALKQALALEEAIQQATAKAEPSIACILVSRSDAYRKFDARLGKPVPGKLGDFQPQAQRFHGHGAEVMARLNMATIDYVPDGYGSGVVIDPDGLILTNYHVVRDATKVFVRLPGRPGWYADIHAADERSDLAVLKLINLHERLPALPMGDGSKLKKGQFILALANPFAAGFRDGNPSVTWGLLSNLRRRVPGETNEVERRRPRLHYYGVLLQTDLRLNLGTSGGALLDLKGNWVGLTTAQAAVAGGDTAGGFAVPLDARMSRIIDVLRRGEEVEYGFLGISLQQFPNTEGVFVNF
ncbi:MAG: trypsin-like peptidase domain-containing protein, partial [Gemmataceae bacterium]